MSLGQAEDLEGLLLGNEATLDPQPFLCDLLPTDVLMLLPEGLVVLLFKIGLDLEVFLLRCQRPMLVLHFLRILLLIFEAVLLHQNALVKRLALLLHFVVLILVVLHLLLLEALKLGLLFRRVKLVGLAGKGETRFFLLN